MSALVEAAAASRRFARGEVAVTAVRAATCHLAAGARVAVTGPSGSGKSTLLHLLAGLDTPTDGAVTWPGLGGSPVHRPGVVGLVFQGPSLVPALDVVENVQLPLLLAGVDDGEARARALAALRAVGVADLGSALPEEVSGGQAQRVAVARVLACRPRLILADEPTGQLDRATATVLVDALLAAADELDAALLVATHDPVVADLFEERWEMVDGLLVTEEAAA